MKNPRHLNIDDLERFLTFYKSSDDPLRQILIGHLLIEEMLMHTLSNQLKILNLWKIY